MPILTPPAVPLDVAAPAAAGLAPWSMALITVVVLVIIYAVIKIVKGKKK